MPRENLDPVLQNFAGEWVAPKPEQNCRRLYYEIRTRSRFDDSFIAPVFTGDAMALCDFGYCLRQFCDFVEVTRKRSNPNERCHVVTKFFRVQFESIPRQDKP